MDMSHPTPQAYPLDCCSWGVYVRFHGSTGQYQGEHGDREMGLWAQRAQQWAATGRQVWLAFNNDAVSPGQQLPAAIRDCRSLAAALRRVGAWAAT